MHVGFEGSRLRIALAQHRDQGSSRFLRQDVHVTAARADVRDGGLELGALILAGDRECTARTQQRIGHEAGRR